MLRSLCLVLSVYVAPLAAVHAQNASGTCGPVDPIVSNTNHFCENHSGHDHSGLFVTNVDMGTLNLTGGSLAGATLTDCNLVAAKFPSADLSNCSWIDCFADRVYLGNADCTSMDFSGTRVRYAYLMGANLAGAILTSDFYDTNFTGADFTTAVLSSGPDMADLSEANLTNAVGLNDTIGVAIYNVNTDFTGTGFDPVAAGWILSAEELLFRDDFESGDFASGGWTIKNTLSVVSFQPKFQGKYGARVKKRGWFEKPLSTFGYETIRVQYQRRTARYDAAEFLRVEWWDGGGWNTLELTTDEDWAQPEFILPAGANDNPNFKLRFKSVANRKKERGDIDNVEIFGTPL